MYVYIYIYSPAFLVLVVMTALSASMCSLVSDVEVVVAVPVVAAVGHWSCFLRDGFHPWQTMIPFSPYLLVTLLVVRASGARKQ